MKRSSGETSSLVYAYGCGRPQSGLEYAYAEQERNRAFWDRLVVIDELHDVSILAAASADHEQLVDLRDAIYRDGQTIGALIDERAAQRKAARGNVDTPALDEQIETVSAARKEHRTQYYGLLNAWRKANPEAMREFGERRKCAMKDARNASGLYWGSYNRVLDSYERGRSLAMKTGRRMRRSDDERTDGCLAIQIQRTKSGLGAAPAELFDGSFSGLQIAQSSVKQRLMQFRVDAEGHMLTIPVFWHRELPADCRVKTAQLTWNDGGARGRVWKLCLTISRPKQTIIHPHPDDAVGIDIGWRLRDGALRVAYWSGTDGHEGELALSTEMMEHMDWVEQTRSEIDVGEYGRDEIAKRRAQLRERGGRRKDIGQRREQYRLFARELAMRYGVIGIENVHIAQLARRGDAEAHEGSRSQRVRAACHILLEELKHQAAKHGCRLLTLGGASTMLCAECGTSNDPQRPENLIWRCTGCEATWDQDRNAARNLMLSAVAHASAQVPQEVSVSKNKMLPIDDRKHYRTARNDARKA